MLIEVLKIVVSLLGGGLAGAFFNEWLRRRSGKVHKIPLIERVNRLVTPELEGITLARVTGDSEHRHLEELKNLREYQLTLRNTARLINLQDIEIQFEFPTEDVQAWVERPAMSRTALITIEAIPSDPWKKAFRWRIPHLPSGDSVEFTFRAVGSPSGGYEVALYKSERVIVEKVAGEPAPRESRIPQAASAVVVPAFATLIIILVPILTYNLTRDHKAQLEPKLTNPAPLLLSQTSAVVARKRDPLRLALVIPSGNFDSYDLEVEDKFGVKKFAISVGRDEANHPMSILVPPGLLDTGTYYLVIDGADESTAGNGQKTKQEVARIPFSIEFRDL